MAAKKPRIHATAIRGAMLPDIAAIRQVIGR